MSSPRSKYKVLSKGQGQHFEPILARGFIKREEWSVRWEEKSVMKAKVERVSRDFPGGTVVKNPPANAGNMGSSPGLGRSHIATEQLSLCTTTTEPAL